MSSDNEDDDTENEAEHPAVKQARSSFIKYSSNNKLKPKRKIVNHHNKETSQKMGNKQPVYWMIYEYCLFFIILYKHGGICKNIHNPYSAYRQFLVNTNHPNLFTLKSQFNFRQMITQLCVTLSCLGTEGRGKRKLMVGKFF